MKGNYEERFLKEQREKEKEIKIFNENLKNSNFLLNDSIYVFRNIFQIRLKLKQLPIKYLDNVLFITEYFKTERETINFKKIKPEILNNELFLLNAIKNNPELFFLISEENKKIFKDMAILADKEYLKYLNKEDYDNPEIIKKVSLNFKSFNKSLMCISQDILKKLLSSNYAKEVEKAILELTKEQCQYFKVTLNNYLEENKKEKGLYWFENVLVKNPYLYTVLDKDKYKDSESKKIILSIVSKYNDLFMELPEEWKNDLGVITTLLYDKSAINAYQSYTNCHRYVIDASLILNEYDSPENFLANEFHNFTDENLKHIRKIYPYLTQEWRNQSLIIKSLFKEKDEFEIDIEYCKKIPNSELSELLINQLKNFKIKSLSNVGATLEKVVMYYFMKEGLEYRDIKEKKLKI